MSLFHEMAEEAKKLVKERLADKENRPAYMLESQLNSILGELDKMEQIRNSGLFFPYYPKGIADGWDYADPLAGILLRLLGEYCKL